MTKKRVSPPPATIPVRSLAESATPGVSVIDVPPGGVAMVIVDVGTMTVPYTVAYAGRTVIKSLVDRAQTIDLLPGDQVLGWAFAHMTKGWHHTIGMSVNGEPPMVLESRSEAKKDEDHSVNFAIVRVQE